MTLRETLHVLFPPEDPLTPVQVLSILLMVVIVALVLRLIQLAKRHERNAVQREAAAKEREAEAEAREAIYQLHRRAVEAFFDASKKVSAENLVVLGIVKTYLEMIRSNSSTVAAAATATAGALTANQHELERIAAQTRENADKIVSKSDELRTVIPDLTVKKMKQSDTDSGIIRSVDHKPDPFA